MLCLPGPMDKNKSHNGRLTSSTGFSYTWTDRFCTYGRGDTRNMLLSRLCTHTHLKTFNYSAQFLFPGKLGTNLAEEFELSTVVRQVITHKSTSGTYSKPLQPHWIQIFLFKIQHGIGGSAPSCSYALAVRRCPPPRAREKSQV